MAIPSVVIDTNVVASAMRSMLGTSHALLSLVGGGKFKLNLSVPLLLEYEKTLLDPRLKIPFSVEEIGEILDYLCASAHHQEIHFLWRPMLSDPNDDMLLELAVASRAQYIVTFNKRDFRGIRAFGVKAVTPREFLKHLGVKE
jgi:putative PIN family toxin of toxin-antitoxin system